MSPHPPSKSDLTDIDLYCLNCGYNLRGLSGDPRRCPECGQLSPLEELLIPAKLIRAQLRRMETAPALCVGVIVIAAISVLLTLIVFLTSTFFELQGYLVAVLPCLIVWPVWKANAKRFRESCRDNPGWRAALWQYHLRGIPLCLVVAVVVVLCSSLPRQLSWGFGREFEGLMACAALVVVPFFLYVAVWVHRGLKDALRPLQRDVAVALAREEAARRRSRGKL